MTENTGRVHADREQDQERAEGRKVIVATPINTNRIKIWFGISTKKDDDFIVIPTIAIGGAKKSIGIGIRFCWCAIYIGIYINRKNKG